jgi:ABC-2 type transport system ATP-binding protein
MALIQLDHLCRRYGEQIALVDVTLKAEPGIIGLLGPNGAGKSTLLKILLRLLPASEGTARVLDVDVENSGLSLRRQIGYMPEADAIIPGMEGIEFITLAGRLHGLSRRQASRRAHEILSCLGLEEVRYRPVEEYSTGMKQRIKLAQALVHDPPLLFLDEPTSGLDPAGREHMLGLLWDLGHHHRKSLVISTHLLGDVERICDTVIILNHGRIVRHGCVADLRAQRPDRYWLRIDGERTGFIKDLVLEGARILHDDGQGGLRVAVPPHWRAISFFALADNQGVAIRGLERDDEHLEELFFRAIDELQAAGV